MYAENFYIALYDDEREAINFPYYVDTVDTDIPDPDGLGAVRSRQRPRGHGLCPPTGRPSSWTEPHSRARRQAARSSSSGSSREGDWLGAPLIAEGRTLGLLVVPDLHGRRSATPRPTSTCWRSSASTSASALDAASGPSRRPASATRSWRSSTRSARRSPSSSSSRRSSSSSASASARSSTRARCSSPSTTRHATALVPVRHRRGRAVRSRARRPLGPGLTSTVITTERPLRVGTHRASRWRPARVQVGGTHDPVVARRADRRPAIGSSASSASRALDAERLQRGRRAAAGDARREHGRRPRERPPVRRDQAAAGRDRRASGRAGGDQRDRRRAGRAARLRRRSSSSSASGSARCSTADRCIIALFDPGDAPASRFPYERRRRSTRPVRTDRSWARA